MSSVELRKSEGEPPPVVPPPAPVESSNAVDVRFRTLIGEAAWAELPEAVRRRFSKRLGPDEAVIYRGNVTETRLSRAGRVLSFLARAIGAPLPLSDGATGPALVIVTEDARMGGQCWLRIYQRPGHFPQAIHSAKRFRGSTGLEEYVGCGVGMSLRVTVEGGALVFRSVAYFLELGRYRLSLPRALHPGRMRIEHRDEGGGTFAFALALTHPWLGGLVHQLAYFHDA